jgi:hypothetical protein
MPAWWYVLSAILPWLVALALLLSAPAWAQFQSVDVIVKANRNNGTFNFPNVTVPTGVRGLRAVMDISESVDPLPAISVTLEGSLDGGSTWMPAGAFTRSAGPKGLDKSGNLQTTTAATFTGGTFWSDTTNASRRLRGNATISGAMRFGVTVQPL